MTVVLLLVMVGVSLGKLLSDVADGRVPSGLLWLLIGLNMPQLLTTILPLAVFIAVIWGLGRLYQDQEMAVMRASGFRWQMMLRPLLNLLLPIAAALLLVGLYVAPTAAAQAQSQLEQAFRNASEWGLQAGQFHVLQGGDLVLYVAAVEKDGRTLQHVFIQKRDGEREQVWVARQGYYWLDPETGNRYLTLEDGQITEGGTGSLDFGIMQFSRNDLRMPEIGPSKRRAVGLESRPSGEILFSPDPAEAAEFQSRVSYAIAAVVLGLLAIPLSHSAPREGRSGRVVLGILTYVVYMNLLYTGRDWIATGAIPPQLGIWWVHLLVLVTAMTWMQRQGRMVGKG